MKRIGLISITIAILQIVGCTTTSDDRNVLNQQQDFTCQKPGSEEFVRWGETGWARVCDVRNGSYIVAENGKIFLKGQYADGAQVGIWRWYDGKGSVTKEIDYSMQK